MDPVLQRTDATEFWSYVNMCFQLIKLNDEDMYIRVVSSTNP